MCVMCVYVCIFVCLDAYLLMLLRLAAGFELESCNPHVCYSGVEVATHMVMQLYTCIQYPARHVCLRSRMLRCTRSTEWLRALDAGLLLCATNRRTAAARCPHFLSHLHIMAEFRAWCIFAVLS